MSAKWLRGVALGCLVWSVAGCEGILSPYDGPRPAKDDIRGETAIVRYADTASAGNLSFIVDRTRFVDSGDPHDVNRVVKVFTDDSTVAQVRELELRPGDRVRISTRYARETETADLTEVPNWPGHGHYEYPIGLHRFTAVERVP